MDVRAREIAETYDGLLTWAALRDAGLSRAAAWGQVAGLRRLHDGVFLTGHGRLTAHQRHLAATLTTPGSVLIHASAGAAWGLRPWEGGFEVVTRPGTSGPLRTGGLLICHSTRLDGWTTTLDGVPITTAARTIVDLAAHLPTRQRDRAVREAIRLGTTTAREVQRAALAHRGRRGTKGLAALAARLDGLPVLRTRSDAEALALDLLAQAEVGPPRVNVRVAGEECDLSWPDRRLIVEIDGPQFHRDPAEDARKTRAWVAAGWRVVRLPSDAVYDAPDRLVELAQQPRACRELA